MHFFEALERENDYQQEYEKLEELCAEIYPVEFGYISIRSYIDKNFLEWKGRLNYTSFDEVIHHLITFHGDDDLLFYFLYSELMLNIMCDLQIYNVDALKDISKAIFDTIRVVVSKAGFKIQKTDKGLLIIEENAAAIEVADIVPDIADLIIEYNHYFLRGNIKKKKEILKWISDALEPKRNELNNYCKSMTDSFFAMVNNLDIRHNNCDPKDASKYNHKFDMLSIEKKEELYDVIYEEALALFIMMERQKRLPLINEFKNK